MFRRQNSLLGGFTVTGGRLAVGSIVTPWATLREGPRASRDTTTTSSSLLSSAPTVVTSVRYTAMSGAGSGLNYSNPAFRREHWSNKAKDAKLRTKLSETLNVNFFDKKRAESVDRMLSSITTEKVDGEKVAPDEASAEKHQQDPFAIFGGLKTEMISTTSQSSSSDETNTNDGPVEGKVAAAILNPSPSMAPPPPIARRIQQLPPTVLGTFLIELCVECLTPKPSELEKFLNNSTASSQVQQKKKQHKTTRITSKMLRERFAQCFPTVTHVGLIDSLCKAGALAEVSVGRNSRKGGLSSLKFSEDIVEEAMKRLPLIAERDKRYIKEAIVPMTEIIRAEREKNKKKSENIFPFHFDTLWEKMHESPQQQQEGAEASSGARDVRLIKPNFDRLVAFGTHLSIIHLGPPSQQQQQKQQEESTASTTLSSKTEAAVQEKVTVLSANSGAAEIVEMSGLPVAKKQKAISNNKKGSKKEAKAKEKGGPKSKNKEVEKKVEKVAKTPHLTLSEKKKIEALARQDVQEAMDEVIYSVLQQVKQSFPLSKGDWVSSSSAGSSGAEPKQKDPYYKVLLFSLLGILKNFVTQRGALKSHYTIYDLLRRMNHPELAVLDIRSDYLQDITKPHHKFSEPPTCRIPSGSCSLWMEKVKQRHIDKVLHQVLTELQTQTTGSKDTSNVSSSRLQAGFNEGLFVSLAGAANQRSAYLPGKHLPGLLAKSVADGYLEKKEKKLSDENSSNNDDKKNEKSAAELYKVTEKGLKWMELRDSSSSQSDRKKKSEEKSK